MSGLGWASGWGEAGGSGRCWGEAVRTAAGAGEGGGQRRKRRGGVAAPGSPRCAREIGRQEAAAGNPGAGNGRCRLPDGSPGLRDPQPRCLPPTAGYHPGMLQVSRPLPSGELGVPRVCPGEVALLPWRKSRFPLALPVEMEPQPCSWLGSGGEERVWGN